MPEKTNLNQENIAGEEVPPRASSLVESLRNFGYSLPTAIADLVDNSIAAEASEIQILTSFKEQWLAIVDNGNGIQLNDLLDAMRLGSVGPMVERSKGDLGRFGLGLKTASFSQGRRLTVISKHQEDGIKWRVWDLDHICKTDTWTLLLKCSKNGEQMMSCLDKLDCGTIILIEKLDRLPVKAGNDETRFDEVLAEVAGHLRMVFHRYIEKHKLQIKINSELLTPWDPFLRKHQSTQLLPVEANILNDSQITVQPYILPHHSKLTQQEHDEAAGVGGWNDHQGFYLYRNDRLIVAGSWLGLGIKKEEHCKLARISVDISSSLDQAWKLNIMKSHAFLPDSVRKDIRRIAKRVRVQASDVYRHRGSVISRTTSQPETFIWIRKKTRKSVKYTINRKHPLIKSIFSLNSEEKKKLQTMLRLLEEGLPIAAIVSDSSEAVDSQCGAWDGWKEDNITEIVNDCYNFLVRNGLSPQAAKQQMLQIEPFSVLGQDLFNRLR